MHIEAEITVARPRSEVFDYLARAEHLPEYVTDFAWVKQVSDGEPDQRHDLQLQDGPQQDRGHVRLDRVRARLEARLAWAAGEGGARVDRARGSVELSEADAGPASSSS